jgi:hypothetical protein
MGVTLSAFEKPDQVNVWNQDPLRLQRDNQTDCSDEF